MPKTSKPRRRPIKIARLGGVTITLQRFDRPPATCRLVLRENGKTVRQQSFPTLSAGEMQFDAWVARASSTGAKAAATITEADERNLLNWREQLSPFHADVGDAVAFYLKHLRASRSSKPVREVIDALLATKERKGKRESYLGDLTKKLDRFERSFRGRMIGDISAGELERWLDKLEVGAVTWNNFRRNLCVLFNFAMRQGWAEANVAAAAVLEPRDTEDPSPEVLTPAEARALLNAASLEVLPYFAIALFAGVRDAELTKLDWRQVNLATGYITIEAAVSKTKRKRLVPISDNLRAWITPLAKTRGPVVPEKPRALLEKARVDAGITDWPHNACRHSFGTYEMARTRDVGHVSEVMGNSPNVCKRHYAKAVPFELGDEFFSILPRPVDGADRVVPMVRPESAPAAAGKGRVA